MTQITERKEHIVFLRRVGEQQERAEDLENFCRPLLGSDAYVDNDGNISYYSWRSVPPEIRDQGLLPAEYIIISGLHPRANIYAPHTRFLQLEEQVINLVTADDGAVETAIRLTEHIIVGERGRETDHVAAVKLASTDLLDLFHNRSFAQISPDELKEAQLRTLRLLQQVKLDPRHVVDQEKKRMTHWLLKGSIGKDTLDRYNWLITMGALSAAYRTAIQRYYGMGEIEGKYIRMREALIFARSFSRNIFTDVLNEYLRPEALPAHEFFKYPTNRLDKNVGIVTGILKHLIYLLNQPQVKTYRTVGRQAAEILEEVVQLLRTDHRVEIVERQLFNKVSNLLSDELERRAHIYPPSEFPSMTL